MTFGEKLKSLRTMNAIAQSDIAEICGVAVFTVSRWETGNSFPTKNNLVSIAKMFGVNPIDFLENDFPKSEKEKIKQAQNYYSLRNRQIANSQKNNLSINISELSPEGLRELDHFIKNMLLTNPRYRKSR